MQKTVTYKEPASYFNEEMLKAARQWDKEHKKTGKAGAQSKAKSTDKAKKK